VYKRQTIASPTPTARPSPSPTATPTAYYKAQNFEVKNGDLENGDTVANLVLISTNTDYDAREGSNGDLYRNGSADMLGRAFSVVQVVNDGNGNRKFVVLIDRIDTYQDAQKYFQRQQGLIQSQSTPMSGPGEQAIAGIVPVNGQQTYQLFIRDVNIFITIATVPGASTNVADYFLAIARNIIGRGQQCRYSTTPSSLPGLPGNPSTCVT